jgi:hypothetical protein
MARRMRCDEADGERQAKDRQYRPLHHHRFLRRMRYEVSDSDAEHSKEEKSVCKKDGVECISVLAEEKRGE